MRVPWIKFKVQDWQEGTAQLSAIEYALYHKICVSIWQEGKAVHESSAPALMAGVSAEDAIKALARLVLIQKVKLDEHGNCWNPPALKAHNEAASRIELARQGGKESGRVRRERKEPARVAPSAAPAELPRQDPYPHIEIDRLKMVYPKHAAGPGTIPWNRVTEEIWEMLKLGDTFDEMVAGVERYAVYCEAVGNVGTQFVRSPVNFIRDRLYKGEWTPPLVRLKKSEQAQQDQERIVAALKEKYGS